MGRLHAWRTGTRPNCITAKPGLLLGFEQVCDKSETCWKPARSVAGLRQAGVVLAQKFWGGALPHQSLHHRVHFLETEKYELHI